MLQLLFILKLYHAANDDVRSISHNFGQVPALITTIICQHSLLLVHILKSLSNYLANNSLSAAETAVLQNNATICMYICVLLTL